MTKIVCDFFSGEPREEPLSEEDIQAIAEREPTLQDTIESLKSEIAAMEAQYMLPRITREFMLQSLEAQFTPEQLAQNIGYTRVKKVNDDIGAKRQRLSDLQGKL